MRTITSPSYSTEFMQACLYFLTRYNVIYKVRDEVYKQISPSRAPKSAMSCPWATFLSFLVCLPFHLSIKVNANFPRRSKESSMLHNLANPLNERREKGLKSCLAIIDPSLLSKTIAARCKEVSNLRKRNRRSCLRSSCCSRSYHSDEQRLL
jgi:hypothetical protein